MSLDPSRITCKSCGKSYAYKAEYAGRSVRCKCGQAIRIVAPVPAAVAVSAADEFDRAFSDEGYDLAPVAAAPALQAAPRSARVLEAIAARKPLDYATPPPSQTAFHVSHLKDIYVPAALIIAGVIMMFVDARMEGIRNPAIAMAYVVLMALANITLVAISIFTAMKLLDLGLGTLGPAIIKLLAVAIFPGAVAGIISHAAAGMIYWGVCLILYYALLSYLFEMDGSEIRVAAGIIWALRFISRLAILAVIASSHHLPGAPASAPIATNSPSNSSPGNSFAPGTGTNPPAASAAHDDHLAKIIAKPNSQEACAWCTGTGKFPRAGMTIPATTMLEIANSFYAAGAKKVWAVNMLTLGNSERCPEMIIEMPDDTGTRKKLLARKDDYQGSRRETADTGNRYFEIKVH